MSNIIALSNSLLNTVLNTSSGTFLFSILDDSVLNQNYASNLGQFTNSSRLVDNSFSTLIPVRFTSENSCFECSSQTPASFLNLHEIKEMISEMVGLYVTKKTSLGC